MILVKIRKYASVAGVTHESTSWKVATDEAMTNILESKERTNMLELYFSTIEVPPNVTYYVQARRHFNLPHMDYDVEPIAVSNNNQKYDNMLLASDSFIEEPYIKINRDELMDNDDATLTFKTSKIKSNVDKHLATHYFILDHNDNVIFSKLYETENLTSLEIPNSHEYRDKNKIKFVAIHVGATGIESKPGILTMYFNRDLNWEFDKNISGIEPRVDFTVGFKPLNDSKVDVRIVEVKNPNNGELILKFEGVPLESFTIPWTLLTENITYQLDITYVNNSQRIKTTKMLTTASYNNLIIRDESYIYQNTLMGVPLKSFYIPNNLHIEAMYNGNILVPKETKRLDIFRWDSVNKEIIKTTGEAEGIKLPGDSVADTCVKVLSRSLILIDTLNDIKKPVFMLYRYNLGSNNFTLLQTLERKDEHTPLGKTNSMVQFDINTIYYIPVGMNKLRKYDLVTNTVTDLVDNMIDGMDKGLLIRSRSNRLFICNGPTYEAVVYNIYTNKIVPGYNYSPETFINKESKVVQLYNGSTLIFLSRDENHDQSKGVYQYYDYTNGKLIRTKNTYNDKMVPSTSIFLNTGEVVLLHNYVVEDELGRPMHDAQMYLYQ